MPLPDAAPADLLAAFLAAHAAGDALPAGLYARGEELHARLAADPPASADWGRFLVAMGHLAAERLGDDRAAGLWFQQAVQQFARHGEAEAAVAAGLGQGVIQERRGAVHLARAAYTAAATLAARHAITVPAGLLAVAAAVRLHFAEHGSLRPDLHSQLKQAWLGWLWLRRRDPAAAAQADGELGRLICALLLPEDDPTRLAEAWRDLAPHAITAPDGAWNDGDPECLDALYGAAAEAADRHLTDETAQPGQPYRLLREALARAGAAG